MRRERGASLSGLMFTLTLAAILTTLAAPVFSNLAANTRLQTGTERLYTAIWFARSEAIMRARSVVIAARDEDWEAGWEIFVDANGDGRRQAEETLLRQSPGAPERVSIHANAGIGTAVHYQADGRTRRPSGSLQMGTVTLCHGGSVSRARGGRGIVINTAGRPRITRDPAC